MTPNSIEELTFSCLCLGRNFANACEQANIPMPPHLAKNYRRLLEHLEGGEIPCMNEFEIIKAVARALRTAMNKHKPGYGDRAFRMDTDEDLLFDGQLDQMRKAVNCYMALMQEHVTLKDRLTAMRWARFKMAQT
jgi:hypothetical protein